MGHIDEFIVGNFLNFWEAKTLIRVKSPDMACSAPVVTQEITDAKMYGSRCINSQRSAWRRFGRSS